MKTASTRVVVLKSPNFGSWAREHAGRLPYGVDRLHDIGMSIRTTDATFRRPFTVTPVRQLVASLEGVGTPFVQTLLLSRDILSSRVTIAMFESEGHFLGLVRSLNPLRSTRRLVIIACWLAEIAPALPPWKRRLYRRIYRHVDLVIVFSPNQVAVLESELGIDPHGVVRVLRSRHPRARAS